MKKLFHSPAQVIFMTSWLVITLVLAAMILLGLPAWFAALKQVCMGTSQECQSLLQLTPAQANVWPSLDWYAWYNVITRGIARLLSFILGVLIFIRKPDSRIAWVTSVFLIVGTENGIGTALARLHPIWQIPSIILGTLGFLSLVLFALLFPNDRFTPLWTRWLIIPWAILAFSLYVVPRASLPDELLGITLLLFILLLIGILVYRYWRVFTWVDRQKAKWVIYAFAIGFGLFVAGIAVSVVSYGFDDPVMSPGMWILQDIVITGVDFLLPSAIAISVLRYQLFDIDVIIRKTLVYTALTGLLALLYFGSVTVLQAVFSALGSNRSPLVTVVSTLVIAAFFSPLRNRVQGFIDHRFYRSKYDATRALANFALVAGNQTDLQVLAWEIQTFVQTTLQPEFLSFWIKPVVDQRNE